MSETNPYAPPQARVDEVIPTRGSVGEFERFTTWGVLLFTIVTLTCYVPYWLYTRTRILDRVLPTNPTPRVLVNIAMGSFILNIVLSALQSANPTSTGIAVLASLISMTSGISMVVWVYMFRSRLNMLLNAEPGDPLRLGPIMPFFFHVLYLQYKINAAIDARAR